MASRCDISGSASVAMQRATATQQAARRVARRGGLGVGRACQYCQCLAVWHIVAARSSAPHGSGAVQCGEGWTGAQGMFQPSGTAVVRRRGAAQVPDAPAGSSCTAAARRAPRGAARGARRACLACLGPDCRARDGSRLSVWAPRATSQTATCCAGGCSWVCLRLGRCKLWA